MLRVFLNIGYFNTDFKINVIFLLNIDFIKNQCCPCVFLSKAKLETLVWLFLSKAIKESKVRVSLTRTKSKRVKEALDSVMILSLVS